MALKKYQWTGILGGILVFFIPVALVSYIYLSKKPNVKVLPFLGEHEQVSEDITEYYTLPQFQLFAVNGDTLSNNSYKEKVRLAIFGNAEVYDSDYASMEPFMQEFIDFPELQFLYHFQLDQNSSATIEPGEYDCWNIVARSNFENLKASHLLQGQDRIALVDRLGHIRGTYSDSAEDLALLKTDFQNLMVENHHQTKKKRRSDRFSRESDEKK